jgi:predicted DNA-binding protein
MARRSISPKGEAKATRASVSFPPNIYDELEKLAVAKKVSLAWVVREAAEKYIADQWPLLGNADQEDR